ncbi:TolB family protein [Rhizobium halophytocola]|uniref:Tol biopolymer transport system component n=1 Tax=Rhizobium halophytocola TaxID=735519 RepID=A0ABS4DZ57_9HYPH|nr:PD40 domain-containing protein [Rhizobium halophytocola]MBP1850976.1 Tol biopolymer transport system component [Rhizobium halophytocola]
MRSSVEIYDLATRRTRVIFQTTQLVEAPNWTPDGLHLIVNGDGLLYRLAVEGADTLEPIDTGFAVGCNNDHGISPDGRSLVISDKTEYGKSCIYTLPVGGGVPLQVTAQMPSYWHGWSPDGQTLAYCGIRNDEFDIYTISVDGEPETRLTFGEGRNDGPDFSADGQWIYFNSSRTGLMQIWRMHCDGSALQQLTDDNYGNWFAHPSPDGEKVVLISYDPDVFDHPRDKQVRIRLMKPDGSDLETLFELFGGQGSINVPSWSPDGRAFAFVRYFPEQATHA